MLCFSRPRASWFLALCGCLAVSICGWPAATFGQDDADAQVEKSADPPAGDASSEVAGAQSGENAAGTTEGNSRTAAEPTGGAETDAADHGEHHDPYDLGHGDASPALEDPAQWKYDMAIYTFVVFLLLVGVLMKFAWGPIIQGLDKRENAIAQMIEDARISQEKSALQLREYEAKLAAASEEAQELVHKARRDAETVGERIRAEAETAATRERQRALDDIRLAKEQALQEIADQVSQNAFLVASRVLGREINPDDHQRLIQDSLQRFPNQN